jgi:hypothetical protein
MTCLPGMRAFTLLNWEHKTLPNPLFFFSEKATGTCKMPVTG